MPHGTCPSTPRMHTPLHGQWKRKEGSIKMLTMDGSVMLLKVRPVHPESRHPPLLGISLIPSSSALFNEVLKSTNWNKALIWCRQEKCPASCFFAEMNLSSTCVINIQIQCICLLYLWPIQYTISVLHLPWYVLCARAAAGSFPVGKTLYCPRAVFCYTARPAIKILNESTKLFKITDQ